MTNSLTFQTPGANKNWWLTEDHSFKIRGNLLHIYLCGTSWGHILTHKQVQHISNGTPPTHTHTHPYLSFSALQPQSFALCPNQWWCLSNLAGSRPPQTKRRCYHFHRWFYLICHSITLCSPWQIYPMQDFQRQSPLHKTKWDQITQISSDFL